MFWHEVNWVNKRRELAKASRDADQLSRKFLHVQFIIKDLEDTYRRVLDAERDMERIRHTMLVKKAAINTTKDKKEYENFYRELQLLNDERNELLDRYKEDKKTLHDLEGDFEDIHKKEIDKLIKSLSKHLKEYGKA